MTAFLDAASAGLCGQTEFFPFFIIITFHQCALLLAVEAGSRTERNRPIRSSPPTHNKIWYPLWLSLDFFFFFFYRPVLEKQAMLNLQYI